jgi:RNA polymerase sigma factor (sigma-70 family)
MDLVRFRRRHVGEGHADLSALTGREADPADTAEMHDTASELRRMLAGLPQNQREAIHLWCGGFSYREIAEIAAQSEGNVRVLVHRAIKQLRRLLKVTN